MTKKVDLKALAEAYGRSKEGRRRRWDSKPFWRHFYAKLEAHDFKWHHRHLTLALEVHRRFEQLESQTALESLVARSSTR